MQYCCTKKESGRVIVTTIITLLNILKILTLQDQITSHKSPNQKSQVRSFKVNLEEPREDRNKTFSERFNMNGLRR
jgi:hypothetical protein